MTNMFYTFLKFLLILIFILEIVMLVAWWQKDNPHKLLSNSKLEEICDQAPHHSFCKATQGRISGQSKVR